MRQVRISIALIASIIGIVIGALAFARFEVKDPDLQPAVYLLAPIIGGAVIFVLLVRMCNAVLLNRIQAKAPDLYEGYRGLGRILAVASLATLGLVNFSVFAFEDPKRVDYSDLSAAVVFAALLAFSLLNLLRVIKALRVMRACRRLQPGGS